MNAEKKRSIENKISIIIPVYKVEKYIYKCINSIINQTYKNLEIILIDDGSPDNCGKICDEFAKKDTRIVVLHKQNGGLSSARNAGLDICTGQYVGFVDSDDFIETNMFEVLLNGIENYDVDISCVGIFREVEFTSEKYVIRCPKCSKVYDDHSALEEILLGRDIDISVWSKLYKWEVFEDVRFPEGETNEDAATLLRTIVGRKVMHTSKPMYHYIDRVGSITSKYNVQNCGFFWKNAQEIMSVLLKDIPSLKDAAEHYTNIGLMGILFAYMYQNEIVDPSYKRYFNYYKKYWKKLLVGDCITSKDKVKCVLLRMHLLRIAFKLLKK